MTVGIVLSGGGAKGDFEVGALRAIYNRGIRATVFVGTSVGSIHAAKLAEDPASDAPLTDLENLWYQMNGDADMYVLDPVVAFAETQAPNVLNGLKLNAIILGAEAALGAGFPGPLAQIAFLLNLGISAADITVFLENLLNGDVQSLYLLDPIRTKLQTRLDPKAVSEHGAKLRLATVALEAGNLFFVDESANLLSVDASGTVTPTGTQVDLRDAVIASCSIPGIFRPQQLGNDWFVDGGIRNVMPINAALDAGADEIFAIVAAPSGVDPPTDVFQTDFGQPKPITSFARAPIWDILYRALAEIMPDQIQQDAVSLAVANNATIIQPEINVNDSFTIDPGLIRIAAGYGYMKAAECIDRAPSDFGTLLLFLALCENSKSITSLRKQIWLLEYGVAGQLNPQQQIVDPEIRPVPDPGEFLMLRQLKTQVVDLVSERIQLFGSQPRIMVSTAPIDFGDVGVGSTQSRSLLISNSADGGVPANVSDWWLQFEAHPFVNPAASDPWGLFVSVAGTVPAATPPQLTVTVGALHISVTSDNPEFSGAVTSNVLGALDSAELVVTFSPSALGPAAGVITINSDDPANPALEIGVTGAGVDVPASLEVFPAKLNFGSIPDSRERMLAVAVRNPGTAGLPIGAPTIAGGRGAYAFSTDWATPRTLAPYSTNIMNVTFAPGGSGGYSSTLTIVPQTAGIAPASVGLAGTCPRGPIGGGGGGGSFSMFGEVSLSKLMSVAPGVAHEIGGSDRSQALVELRGRVDLATAARNDTKEAKSEAQVDRPVSMGGHAAGGESGAGESEPRPERPRRRRASSQQDESLGPRQ